MHNRAFEKSIHLLTHPFCLCAVGLLMLNDQVLRRFWPSWWTGKLSDFAWLSFAPFLAAAIFAWIPPLNRSRREKWVGRLAFLFIGLTFAAGKALPGVNSLVIGALRPLIGPPSIFVDPSDLIALPMLLVGWRLWKGTPAPAASSRPRWGLVLLPIAVMLTVANSAAPNVGIDCIEATNGSLIARGSYDAYTSTDGGLTWKAAIENTASSSACQNRAFQPSADWQTLTSKRTALTFRYRSGSDIESSTDGGQTWQTAFSLKPMPEATRYYLLKTQSGNPWFTPGPLDALQDPASRNILFSMGQEGTLVYTSSGAWIWSAVGPYRHTQGPPDAGFLTALLSGEFILTLEAGLLVFNLLGLRYPPKVNWLRAVRIAFLILAALAWICVAYGFPPATTSSYAYSATALGLLGAGILLFILALESGYQVVQRSKRALARIVLFSLLGFVLSFLPYLLWAYNALPQYFQAQVFALALVLAVLLMGFLALRTPSRSIQA